MSLKMHSRSFLWFWGGIDPRDLEPHSASLCLSEPWNVRRHLRTDAMQIERRRNQGSGVWGRDTSTEQVRFQKAGKTSLWQKISGNPHRPGYNFRLGISPGRCLRRAPAVRRSAAGAFIMRVEVRGHSPFIEYLKPLWVPLVRRESDPPFNRKLKMKI